MGIILFNTDQIIIRHIFGLFILKTDIDLVPGTSCEETHGSAWKNFKGGSRIQWKSL